MLSETSVSLGSLQRHQFRTLRHAKPVVRPTDVGQRWQFWELFGPADESEDHAVCTALRILNGE